MRHVLHLVLDRRQRCHKLGSVGCIIGFVGMHRPQVGRLIPYEMKYRGRLKSRPYSPTDATAAGSFTGAKPRRKVFSVVTRGHMNCCK